jgi:hypothetical protein
VTFLQPSRPLFLLFSCVIAGLPPRALYMIATRRTTALPMPTPNKDWEEEVLFWGTAIAIFIFAGGIMIFTNHSRHKSESTPAQTYGLMARETKIGPALGRSLPL